jgi:hypothetical protein
MMKLARHTALAGLLCGLSLGAWADGARLSDAQLEDRFWSCDVLATTQVLPAHAAAQCAQWADELKQRRFGGDFDQLLAWWQARKPAEHARRLDTPRLTRRSP